MAVESEGRDTVWTLHKCPKCGSPLLTNDRGVWCSFVGGGSIPACDYGITVAVSVESWNAAATAQGVTHG